MTDDASSGFAPTDDLVHVHDPGVWGWNESFLLSWLPAGDAPAGLFRLGLLPNQGRGWLWCFLLDGDEWLAIEETRLDLRHFDLTDGARYDAWGLRFGWTVREPLERGGFHLDGIARVRNGPRAGRLVPIAVSLEVTATAPCHGTGTGGEPDERPQYPASRFEQSVAIVGTLTVDGSTRALDCPGHRDRSWGPRSWQRTYALGDLQGDGVQLYFAGAPQLSDYAGGYLRDATGVRPVVGVEGSIEYDDRAQTIAPARLGFVTDRDTFEVELTPTSDPIVFDMAHATDPPEHWPYWRIRVAARIVGRDTTLTGWFEANRYGIA